MRGINREDKDTEMTTEDFKELCRVKHDAVDRRLNAIEGKIWLFLGGAFVQLLAVIGWFFVTYIAPRGGN